MAYNEFDELCNEREMGLSEADYNELEYVFAEMDARDSDLQDIDEDERYMGDDEEDIFDDEREFARFIDDEDTEYDDGLDYGWDDFDEYNGGSDF